MNNFVKFINKIFKFVKISMIKLQYKDEIFIGKNLSFRKRLNIRIKNNSKLTIGNNVFFNNDCSLNCMNEIFIGNDCIFGEGVKLYDHNHKFKDRNTLIKDQGYRVDKIKIEDNCWVGSNVIILPGVNIGSNSVIGAGCTIYKDIPANSIVKNTQVGEQLSINNLK